MLPLKRSSTQVHHLSHQRHLNTSPPLTTTSQANPKLAKLKDLDGRLPIHWAASANSYDIVALLADQKGFDPDVQVCALLPHVRTV